MKKLTRQCRLAAFSLLMLMAVNFMAEGCTLYIAYSSALFPSMRQAACAGTKSCSLEESSSATGSCCSEKKKKIAACGCPCCGENCPMGDACTCGHDGKPKSPHASLFFQAPTCHPEQATHNSSYLPLSMRLVFVTAPAVIAPAELIWLDTIQTSADFIGGELPAPPVPPPRYAAA